MHEAKPAGDNLDATAWFRTEFERRSRVLGPLAPVVHRWLFRSAERLYAEFLRREEPAFPAALRTLRLEYQCSPEELLRIPPTGPVILIANHPYGAGLEVLLLGGMLGRIRRDFRFLADAGKLFTSPVREFLIPIVLPRDPQPPGANSRSIRTAVQWLRSGGLVVVFPAGTVAARPFPAFKLTEPPWTDIAAVMARWSNAQVVPVFFHGSNHWTFYVARMLHRDLPYLTQVWHGLSRTRRVIRISIGTPIQPQSLIEERGLQYATSYLRSQTLGMRLS